MISVSFDCRGKMLATGSADGIARTWNVFTGACIKRLAGHSKAIFSVAFDSTSCNLITASGDNVSKIWDINTGNCIHEIAQLTVSPIFAVFNKVGDKVLVIAVEKEATSEVTSTGSISIFHKTPTTVWDIGNLISVYKYLLTRDDTVTLFQAAILDAIYEIIVCRRLVQKKGAQAFTSPEKVVPIEQLRLDFNALKKLQKYFDKLPQSIQLILDPYIKRAEISQAAPAQ